MTEDERFDGEVRLALAGVEGLTEDDVLRIIELVREDTVRSFLTTTRETAT